MSASSRRRVPAMGPAVRGWPWPGPVALCLGLLAFLTIAPAGRAARDDVAAEADRAFAPWRADRVPALSLPTLDGGRARLDDHAGSLRLVHFFATWCEPCRPELTALETLRALFDGRPLTILAIDVGEPADRVRRFIETVAVGFPILLDADKAAMRAWGVDVLPTTFIIDRRGCPLWRVDGDLDWAGPEALTRLRARLDAAPSQLPCPIIGDKP